MKKIIISLFLLAFINLHSQETAIKVEVKFTDGTIKKGKMEIYNLNMKKIKFYEDEKDMVKIDPVTIESAIYYTKDEKVELVRRYNSYIDKNNNVKKISKKPSLMYKTDFNGLIFYHIWSGLPKSSNFRYSNGLPGTMFFLGAENDESAFILFQKGDKGSIILNVGINKNIKKAVTYIYKDTCPKFVEELEKENFNEKIAIDRIYEIYNQYCVK